MVDRIGENYILKATMDEFDEFRMKKNMSDEMKYREKVTHFLLFLRILRIYFTFCRWSVLLPLSQLLIK